MSEVLYRKYRPKKFKDVLGQDHVVSVLKNQIEKSAISHAYIFSGGKGTGKTSSARIFALELGVSPEDLYEMDAASNRGIDDIRAIKEAINISPFSSKYKIYIIDEAHMLSKDAWNALLKTLEEPPSHVIFIFATTELEKVPETILSRCQLFEFKKPNLSLLSEVILETAKNEKREVSKEASDLISLMAEGSFRDAHGILQKTLSAFEGKIDEEKVARVTGAPKPLLVKNFIEGLIAKDKEKLLKVLMEIEKDEIDCFIFIKLTLEKVRNILFIKIDEKRKTSLKESLQKEEFDFLEKIGKEKDLNANFLKKLLSLFNEMYISEKPLLNIEIFVLEVLE